MANLDQTVNQTAKETRTAVKHAGKSVKRGLAKTRKVARETLGGVQTQVAKHPGKSVGLALVAGLALGCMLSLRRNE